MGFKLKDNTRLSLLEELGFNFDGKETYSINYDNMHIFINSKDKLLKLTYLGDTNELKILNHEFCVELPTPIIIYTLVKLDIIEIV